MTTNPQCLSCANLDKGVCGVLLGRTLDEPFSLHKSGSQVMRTSRRGHQVLRRQSVSEFIHILCSGWAFRSLQLEDGQRQILRHLLPGEIFSPVAVFEERSDFAVTALTDIRFSLFSRKDVLDRLAARPDLMKVFARSWAAESASTDKLLTAVGRRSAEQRVAYLFLHLARRIGARSIVRDNRYPLPLRQQHIAETVGLTSIHVNRVIRSLRNRGILELSGGVLKILNQPELEQIGSLR